MRNCLLTCTLVSALTAVQAAEVTLEAQRLPQAPAIDGVLDEAWAKAGRADTFVDCWQSTPAKVATHARVGFDDNNLYLAFVCEEPDPGPLVAQAKDHDGTLWQDDGVEIFLDVNHDRTHYYHLAVNAAGTQLDEACREECMGHIRSDLAWNPRWTAAVKRGAGTWTAEISIPFSELKPGLNSSSEWGINLGRVRQKTPAREAAEISVISPTGRGFHAPRRFATLRINYDWLTYAKSDFSQRQTDLLKTLGQLKEQLAALASTHPQAAELAQQMDAVPAALKALHQSLPDMGTDEAKRSRFVAEAQALFASIDKFGKEMERLKYAGEMAKAFGVKGPKFALAFAATAGVAKEVHLRVAQDGRNGTGLAVVPLWDEVPEVELQSGDLAGPDKAVLPAAGLTWQASGYARGEKFPLKGVPRAVWVAVSAPANATPGVYRGSLAILGNGARYDVHVQVEVAQAGAAVAVNLPPPPPVWDPAQPLPRLDDIPYPQGIAYHYVHRAIKGEYQYVLGPAVAFHQGKLFVTWENRKVSEQSPDGIMRVSSSADDGATWTAPQVLAGGGKGQDYGYGALLSEGGRLWSFTARYQEGGPGVWFHGLRAEAFVLNEDTGAWESRGIVAENFLPLETPRQQANGNWILGGEDRDAHSAVAIIPAKDFLKWNVVKIAQPAGKEFEGQFTVVPDRNEVLAVVRNGEKDKLALLATSEDSGKTWSPLVESNWMMPDAKAYSGVLSTEQRFLISNVLNRENLVLAVGSLGARYFSRIWKIREGRSVQPLYKGNPKRPQWSYPYATEHDGKLYVVYTVGKEDVEVAVIPLKSLDPRP